MKPGFLQSRTPKNPPKSGTEDRKRDYYSDNEHDDDDSPPDLVSGSDSDSDQDSDGYESSDGGMPDADDESSNDDMPALVSGSESSDEDEPWGETRKAEDLNTATERTDGVHGSNDDDYEDEMPELQDDDSNDDMPDLVEESGSESSDEDELRGESRKAEATAPKAENRKAEDTKQEAALKKMNSVITKEGELQALEDAITAIRKVGVPISQAISTKGTSFIVWLALRNPAPKAALMEKVLDVCKTSEFPEERQALATVDSEKGLTLLHTLILCCQDPDREGYNALVKQILPNKGQPYVHGMEVQEKEVPLITALRAALKCAFQNKWQKTELLVDIASEISNQDPEYSTPQHDAVDGSPLLLVMQLSQLYENRGNGVQRSDVSTRRDERVQNQLKRMQSRFLDPRSCRVRKELEIAFQVTADDAYVTGCTLAQQLYAKDPDVAGPLICKELENLVRYRLDGIRMQILLTQCSGVCSKKVPELLVHNLVGKGEEKAVRVLLELGASAEVASAQGATPLMVAIQEGKAGQGLGTLQALLDSGAGANTESLGQLPLFAACNRHHLQEGTANQNELKHWQDVVKALLKSGADITRRDARGATVLEYACSKADTSMVDLLCRHASKSGLSNHLNEADKAGARLLHLVVKRMPNDPTGGRKTQGLLGSLIKHGADLTKTNAGGLMPDQYLESLVGRKAGKQVVEFMREERKLQERRAAQRLEVEKEREEAARTEKKREKQREKQRLQKLKKEERKRLREDGKDIDDDGEEPEVEVKAPPVPKEVIVDPCVQVLDGIRQIIRGLDVDAIKQEAMQAKQILDPLAASFDPNDHTPAPPSADMKQSALSEEGMSTDGSSIGSGVLSRDKKQAQKILQKGMAGRDAAYDRMIAMAEQYEEGGAAFGQAYHLERDEETSNICAVGKVNPEFRNFGGMQWELEQTKAFRDGWSELDSPRQAALVDLLAQLATGNWEGHSTPLATPPEMAGVLLKVSYFPSSRERCVVWEKGVVFSTRIGQFTESIRLWAIMHTPSDAHLKRLVSSIAASHRKGQSCHIQRWLWCDTPAALTGATQAAPLVFRPAAEGAPQEGALVVSMYPPAVADDDQFTLVKFYPITDGLVNNILTKGTLKGCEFQFRVSDTEWKYISMEEDAPTLVLGRSGTGKTTVMVIRMWHQFLQYWSNRIVERPPAIENAVLAHLTEPGLLASDRKSVHHLHQVFTTSNSVLRGEVQKFFHSLKKGHGYPLGPADPDQVNMENVDDGADENRERLHTLSVQAVPHHRFPLFLTKRELLVAVDGTLCDGAEPFFARERSTGRLTEEAEKIAWGKEASSSLQELEEGLDSEDEEEEEEAAGVDTSALGAQKAPQSRAVGRLEIDYDTFVHTIWPDIKLQCTLSPNLVWSEIVSFIKGSKDSVEAKDGHLALSEYCTLGAKRSPNFVGSRPDVYEIFLRYEKRRKQLHAYDMCDAVTHIHRQLGKMGGYQGVRLHSMYVDEVQDFTEAEMRLLMLVTDDTNRFFLTGDTAQTIARGLSFRFSDLRTLFWDAAQTNPRAHAVRDIYKLVNNYRTHAGILQLANFAVELIEAFFPRSIDKLEHDKGLFNGPKPWILGSCEHKDMTLLFLRPGGMEVEFGAQQVIIVRDEASKRKIPPELMNSGLILTVLESKGLEFDDVLLWNFFSDSPAQEEWRCITQYVQQQQQQVEESGDTPEVPANLAMQLQVAGLTEKSKPRPLEFSEERHKVLLDELRQFYTAVTRARVNVWLYEEDQAKRAPAVDAFIRRGLVKVQDPTTTEMQDIGPIARTSSPAEWLDRAEDFERRGDYLKATTCFHRAGAVGRAKLAQARAKVIESRRIDRANRLTGLSGADKERVRLLRLEAAELFLQCPDGVQNLSDAARCLSYCGEHVLSASLYQAVAETGYLGRKMWRQAAAQYKAAGDEQQAAVLFERAGNWMMAANLYEQFGDVHAAVGLFEKHSRPDEAARALLEAREVEALQQLLTRRDTNDSLLKDVLKVVKRDKQWLLGGQLLEGLGRLDMALEFLMDGSCHEASNALLTRHPMHESANFSRTKVDSFAKHAAEQHYKANDREKMLTAIRSFAKLEDKIVALRRYKEPETLTEMLKSEGRHLQAAEILVTETRLANAGMSEALKTLATVKATPESLLFTARCHLKSACLGLGKVRPASWEHGAGLVTRPSANPEKQAEATKAVELLQMALEELEHSQKTGGHGARKVAALKKELVLLRADAVLLEARLAGDPDRAGDAASAFQHAGNAYGRACSLAVRLDLALQAAEDAGGEQKLKKLWEDTGKKAQLLELLELLVAIVLGLMPSALSLQHLSPRRSRSCRSTQPELNYVEDAAAFHGLCGSLLYGDTRIERTFDRLSYRMLPLVTKDVGDGVTLSKLKPGEFQQKISIDRSEVLEAMADEIWRIYDYWLKTMIDFAKKEELNDPEEPVPTLPLASVSPMVNRIQQLQLIIDALQGTEKLKKAVAEMLTEEDKQEGKRGRGGDEKKRKEALKRKTEVVRQAAGVCHGAVRRMVAVLSSAHLYCPEPHWNEVQQVVDSLGAASVQAMVDIYMCSHSGWTALRDVVQPSRAPRKGAGRGRGRKAVSTPQIAECPSLPLDVWRTFQLLAPSSPAAVWAFADALYAVIPKGAEGTHRKFALARTYMHLQEALPGSDLWRKLPLLHAHHKLVLMEQLLEADGDASSLPSPIHCLALCEEVVTAALMARAFLCEEGSFNLCLPDSYTQRFVQPTQGEICEVFQEAGEAEATRWNQQAIDLLTRVQLLLPRLQLLPRATEAGVSSKVYAANRLVVLLCTLLTDSTFNSFPELRWPAILKLLHDEIDPITEDPMAFHECPHMIDVLDQLSLIKRGVDLPAVSAANLYNAIENVLSQLQESMKVLLLRDPMMGMFEGLGFTVQAFDVQRGEFEHRAAEELQVLTGTSGVATAANKLSTGSRPVTWSVPRNEVSSASSAQRRDDMAVEVQKNWKTYLAKRDRRDKDDEKIHETALFGGVLDREARCLMRYQLFNSRGYKLLLQCTRTHCHVCKKSNIGVKHGEKRNHRINKREAREVLLLTAFLMERFYDYERRLEKKMEEEGEVAPAVMWEMKELEQLLHEAREVHDDMFERLREPQDGETFDPEQHGFYYSMLKDYIPMRFRVEDAGYNDNVLDKEDIPTGAEGDEEKEESRNDVEVVESGLWTELYKRVDRLFDEHDSEFKERLKPFDRSSRGHLGYTQQAQVATSNDPMNTGSLLSAILDSSSLTQGQAVGGSNAATTDRPNEQEDEEDGRFGWEKSRRKPRKRWPRDGNGGRGRGTARRV
ncbi:hypothetical protein CYMTET_48820 [Cymbomonas tetramitiformis]|uniref:UvrD-like helicase ATP-binding domain-containing protein n=1 Tax=Cymbomonas tetramitiformis TaxID=36881 RepID=A0AAE0BT32_9CHLO|nr:hypothetical protein CYMTET_48820 [Cymbomonas tetramitiformis]